MRLCTPRRVRGAGSDKFVELLMHGAWPNSGMSLDKGVALISLPGQHVLVARSS
jgi:hypothetical protein